MLKVFTLFLIICCYTTVFCVLVFGSFTYFGMIFGFSFFFLKNWADSTSFV